MTEDKIIGWHHQLHRQEFEQTLGDSERQGSLGCCSPWGCRVGDDLATEQQQQHKIGVGMGGEDIGFYKKGKL